MKTQKSFFILFLLLLTIKQVTANNSDIIVQSPDGKIELNILFREKLNFTVKFKNEYEILPATLTLTLGDGTILGNKPEPFSQNIQKVSQDIKPLYGTKNSIKDEYSELTLVLKDKSTLKFRVYNDAIAYRWVTNIKGTIKVVNEELSYKLTQSIKGWIPEDQTYETRYTYRDISETEKTRDMFLPLVIDGKNNVKLAFTEADLFDYPSLFLRKSNDNEQRLNSSFQKFPTKLEKGGYNLYNLVVKETENCIANTQGTREFPWRIAIIGITWIGN